MASRATSLALALLAWPGAAGADTCAPIEGLAAVLPDDGSEDVPTNVLFRVRYPQGEVAAGEQGWITVSEQGDVVQGTATWDRIEVTWAPAGPLSPGTEYVARIERLLAPPFEARFETGDGADSSAPDESGAPDVSWEWLPRGAPDDPCGPSLGKLHRVVVSPARSLDDSPRDLVEHIVFQSSDESLFDAVEVGRATEDGSAELYLPATDDEREVCFATMPRDAAGHLGAVSSARCVEVGPGPFFRSCSAVPGSTGGVGGIAVLLLCGLLLRRPRPWSLGPGQRTRRLPMLARDLA